MIEMIGESDLVFLLRNLIELIHTGYQLVVV